LKEPDRRDYAHKVRLPALTYRGAAFLGVRPEHVLIGTPGAGLGDGTVSRLEPLGAETLVHLDVRGRGLTARLPGIVEIDVGRTVSYNVESGNWHVFDGDGARLA
jgi:multiple sugar transport system ATP-binding protein